MVVWLWGQLVWFLWLCGRVVVWSTSVVVWLCGYVVGWLSGCVVVWFDDWGSLWLYVFMVVHLCICVRVVCGCVWLCMVVCDYGWSCGGVYVVVRVIACVVPVVCGCVVIYG